MPRCLLVTFGSEEEWEDLDFLLLKHGCRFKPGATLQLKDNPILFKMMYVPDNKEADRIERILNQ